MIRSQGAFQNVAGLAWPWLPLHSGFRSVPPALVFLSLVSYPEPALLFTVVKTKTVLLRAGLSRGSPSHLPIFHWPKQATWLSWTSPGQECLLLFSRGQTVKSHGDFGNSRGRGLRAVCGLPEGTCGPGTGASSFCRTAARREAKHRAVHLFPAPPSTHADKEHKMPAAAAAAETAQEEVAPGHVRIPPRSGRRQAGSRAGSLT